MLTLRIIAGVPNTWVVTVADNGRDISTRWVRSTGNERLFSMATGDVLRAGSESANFWPTTELWMTSGSCDLWWNNDDNRDGLSVAADKNTLPELWSDNLSLSLSPTHNDTCHVHLPQTHRIPFIYRNLSPGLPLKGVRADYMPEILTKMPKIRWPGIRVCPK